MKKITIIFVGTVLLFSAMAQFAVAGTKKKAAPPTNIVGVWKGRVINGATGHELTISADTIKGVKDRKTDLGEGSYTLDTSKTPWAIDVLGTKGDHKGESFYGICKIEGIKLTWLIGSDKKPRPKDFKAKDGGFCLELKKQKAKKK